VLLRDVGVAYHKYQTPVDVRHVIQAPEGKLKEMVWRNNRLYPISYMVLLFHIPVVPLHEGN
jgi:hypothetical protein